MDFEEIGGHQGLDLPMIAESVCRECGVDHGKRLFRASDPELAL